MRGTMLWFNVDKDLGVITTQDGDKIEVLGTAFAPGERPESRCAGKPVEFRLVETDGAQRVEDASFVAYVAPRRARLRHRG
jgi:cold shock CspA family protein